MSNYLPTAIQQFVHISKYARWIPEKNRRETWEETVDRYMDNVVDPRLETIAGSADLSDEIRFAILNLEVLHTIHTHLLVTNAFSTLPPFLYLKYHIPLFSCL